MVVTGISALAQRAAIASPAPDQKAPPPARTTGRVAFRSASSARSSSAGAAADRTGASGKPQAPSGGSIRAMKTSWGTSRYTAPGRPLTAMWKASSVSRCSALGAVGHPAPLGERGQHPLLVDVLDRSPAAPLERGAPGQHDQWHVPESGVGEAGEGVGEARPGGDRTDARATGGEREALRRHGDGTLVAHPDDGDPLVDAAVEQLDDVATPQREERLHAMGVEALSH